MVKNITAKNSLIKLDLSPIKKLTNRKNRVAATDEFVLKDRDYTKDDGIMIGVW